MANRASKGSAFERKICKQLSLWWTGGESDSVFWRTSNSGGRATVRGRKGCATRNQHGDICAVDPVGQPLIDLVTFELKRGYNRCTVADILDKPDHAKPQVWEDWIDKASRTADAAGTGRWMIIAKRDAREIVVWMEEDTWRRIEPKEVVVEPLIVLEHAWGRFVGVTLGEMLLIPAKAFIRGLRRKRK